jgi:hypothetical protein
MHKGTEKYKKAARKGFLNAKTAVELGKEAFLEIKFTYPANMGKVTPQVDMVLDLLSNTIGAALTRLLKEGKWEGTPANDLTQKVCEEHVTAVPSSDNSVPAFALASEHKSAGGLSTTDNLSTDLCSEAVAKEGRVDIILNNPALDKAWDKFISLGEENGFCGVSWKSVGVKPPDEREIYFDGQSNKERGVLKRSVPITTLAFLEIRLVYPGKAAKKTPPEVKSAARKITSLLGDEIRRIGRDSLVK